MTVGIYEVVAVVVSFIIGLVVSRQYYRKFKGVLHDVRVCIDTIDDALADDTVTKEEVKQIVSNCKKIIEDF